MRASVIPIESRRPRIGSKFMCFLCFLCLGLHNILRKRFVVKGNIILSTLPIKLNIMKQFVKIFKHDNPSFLYFKTEFPRLSDAKIKERKFVEPCSDNELEATINKLEA